MNEVITDKEMPNFDALIEGCLERLQCENYSKFSLQQYTWTLRHLHRYMDEQGLLEYTSNVATTS